MYHCWAFEFNMKAATVKQLKDELKELTPPELVELCLRMAKFKKDNKELLTYLLFEAHDEEQYIQQVKEEMEELFQEINTSSYYYIKKSVRKIHRLLRKRIQYSKKTTTEVEILLHFCHLLRDMSPTIRGNTVLFNFYLRQIDTIKKQIGKLHEDLQYDYQLELEELANKGRYGHS